MVVLPAWAMWSQIIGWFKAENWLLVGIGMAIEILQIWMIAEACLTWRAAKGVPPEPLPPLAAVAEATK